MKKEQIEQLNEVLESKYISIIIEELAYQLTAYEQWNMVDYEKGLIDIVISEELEELAEDELIEMYNSFLSEIGEEQYYKNDDTFIDGYFTSPMEAVRAAQYGDYRYADDYVTINGCGNLESLDGGQIANEAKGNNDFKEWILENDYFELLDEDFRSALVSETMQLVSMGY